MFRSSPVFLNLRHTRWGELAWHYWPAFAAGKAGWGSRESAAALAFLPMRLSIREIFFLFVLICAASSANAESAAKAWATVPEILSRITPPKFPHRKFEVTSYGAVGDGVTDCTEAFRKAIDACNQAGGGEVIISGGTFLTGAIHLKSNVNLHVEKSATILFTTNREEYLPVVFVRYEGTEIMNYSPLVYAFEQTNIALTGEGTLDGQGRPGMNGNPARTRNCRWKWPARAGRWRSGFLAITTICARISSCLFAARMF